PFQDRSATDLEFRKELNRARWRDNFCLKKMKGNLMSEKHYSHLTYEERCHISVCLERGMSVRSISLALDRDRSTIYREIKRGQKLKVSRSHYNARFSNALYKKKRSEAAKPRIYHGILKEYVTKKLAEDWSPEQISGRIKIDHEGLSISHETIYQHIWRDKKEGGRLYKHLRRRGRKYKKRGAKHSDHGILGRISIDERPEIVEEKSRVGDWEGDLVIGSHQSGALVTMVDRASKFTKIAFVESKKSDHVRDVIIQMMRPLQDRVLTMTYDNGREFAHHQSISGTLKAESFFAKPYHSWERGLNEHTNGLIRQYLPKGTSFENLSKEKILFIENQLNNRPRKVLGLRTPNEVFFQNFPTHASVALQS
ncbi:MAG: IS30 family transposase, partial [Pseudomonadota bacterium]